MMERCVSRFADTAETEPTDGKLHEDRPLLKHRPAAGFAATPVKQAGDAALTTVKRAHSLGSQVSKKVGSASRSASAGLRRRVQKCATPTRARQVEKREDEASATFDTSKTFEDEYFNDDVFEIGSDDEEEQAFQHPDESEMPMQLNEALSTWGKPGESMDKLGALGGMEQKRHSPAKVSGLNLGSLNPMRSPRDSPTAFYVGTPRDDDWMTM